MSEALWVLETACDDENGDAVVLQGTAFALAGVGIVTCAHVAHTEARAFRANEPNKTVPIKVLARNNDLDLAIIAIPEDYSIELQVGDSASVRPMDEITVLGSPNYNLGDGVLIHQGQVTGFRPFGDVTRILVDAHIVRGNSGGPVLDRHNRVIGLAVTGAPSQSAAAQTENHGVIPINALEHLRVQS